MLASWLLAFHIVFVVCWFAGLLYLPRLFVYHIDTYDSTGMDRFKVMERKLFWGIMTPAGVLATLLGLWILMLNPSVYWHAGWMHTKIILVAALWGFHGYCWKLYQHFQHDRKLHTRRFYCWINEIPTVLLVAIVIMVVVKP